MFGKGTQSFAGHGFTVGVQPYAAIGSNCERTVIPHVHKAGSAPADMHILRAVGGRPPTHEI